MTDRDQDSFPLRIWSGLFKKKHWEKMGPAIWLFGMLVDKITKEENGMGYVLGGKPMTYDDLAPEMPLSPRQYTRHIDILRKYGYIHTVRTPLGLQIVIHKSKKFTTRRSATIDRSQGSDQTKLSTPSDNIGISDKPKKADPYIDNTVDTIKTKEGSIPNFEKLWEKLYRTFKLPEGALVGYKSEIKETIKRLGYDVAYTAIEEFLKATDDHPPNGKIKSITDLLHWKKIDIYVAMIPSKTVWKYYACPVCVQTVKVDNNAVTPAMLELPSMIHHEEIRKDVTSIVMSCKEKDYSPEQIKVVLNKHFDKK